MRRLSMLVTAVSAVALLAPTTALAANVHFVSGPTFTDNGTTLTTTGKLAGIGNQDLTITVSVTGIATKITCTNPGGNQAPGQNKPGVTASGTQTITRDEIKNGTVRINVTTLEPAQLTPKQAGCPNNRWTAEIDDVDFTSARITVVQAGETVFNKTFAL
ncbi:MAG: hypothetical protein M3277_04600 [Actinomycetota bacterium]|nr:hypothetical protein [Actinomycetota bacterium]